MRHIVTLLVTAAMAAALPGGASAQIASPASAPAKRATADFAALPVLESPQLSPDGTKIAALVAANGEQTFTILPLGGGAPSVVRTEQDFLSWTWVNNDWLLIRVGGTVPGVSGEMYVTRAVGVSATGKTVPLLKRESAQTGGDLIWVAHDGTPRVLLGAQRSVFSDNPKFWETVFDVDVSTGEARAVAGPREGVLDWTADANGVVRMGIGRNLDYTETRVLYRDASGRDFREIVKMGATKDDMVLPSVFLPEAGKALTIAKDANGYEAVFEYDLTKLALGKKLHGSDGYDIDGISINPERTAIQAVYLNDTAGHILWLDPDMAKMVDELATRVKGGSPQIYSVSRDHQRAIVFIGSVDSPGGYFLYDRASGELALIGYDNPAIKLARLHPVKTVHYKAADGLDISAVLTMPRAGAKNLPLIVLPHGGPAARDQEGWDWWSQFLADRGYVVIQPNYRGSTGFGSAFEKKGEGQWGLRMQDDLNDAVTYLASEGIADPKRVCMVGGSYGGYAALRAAQRDGAIYRCAVAFAGVSDLQAMTHYKEDFLGSGARENYIRKQAPDLKAVSPLNFPEQFSIPVLVVHGKKDDVVPVKQSREIVERLRKLGKNVTYIEQPLGDHHFTRAEDRLQFLTEMEAFLAKYNPAS